MPKLTEKQIEQARHIDLLTYLREREPQELVRVGPHTFSTKTHGSMRINENGLWNWFRGGFGGRSALDYLVKVQGMDFVPAVQQLCDTGLNLAQPEYTPEQVPEKKPFCLPPTDRDITKVTDYLSGRGIQSAVIQTCVKQGILLQTSQKGYSNCLFVGLDETGTPKSGSIRGCGGNFRGDLSGSEKKYGFCIPARDPDSAIVAVFEAPIDAMSAASIRVLESPKEWQNINYLSLGGLNYQALDQYIQTHPNTRQILFCLDWDEPGRAFTEKLWNRYQGRNFLLEDAPPSFGKDYNDTLRWLVQKKKDTREQER